MRYRQMFWGITFITLILFISDNSLALAASDIDTNIVEGAGRFNELMGNWLDAMIYAAKAISTIMIVLGGLNVALNLGNDTLNKVWIAAFGIGIILNVGLFFSEATWVPLNTSIPTAPHFDLNVQSEENFSKAVEQIADFPRVYREATVAGANYLMGPATKLLLVLTAINLVIKVSLDLVEGDKIRFLTMTVLETGAYFFLITHWYGDTGMNIMGSLCEGFEKLGQNAGGFVDGQPNDILGNSWKIFTAIEATTHEGFHPVDSLITIIFALIILILLVLTGIEMFMARIEFWTLAMATIPLVPFAALPQTRFLFTSALNGMMNLAIKVSVIAFISAVSTGILTDYVRAFTSDKPSSIIGNISLFVQALLVSLLLYLLVKKIPQLVSSLLSGRPELNGATMTQMAKSAAQTGAKVGTAVATGGASFAKSTVGGAMQGGFKAAGAARADGGGFGKQAMMGALGAVGGGMNAAGGSLMSGGANLAKQALFGSSGGGNAGGTSSGGGFLAPFSRGAQIGNAFNGKQEDGSYKTVTSMTGMDKAINAVKDYQEDKKQNGAHVAKVDALDKVMTGASQAINNAKMSVAQSSVVGKAYSSGYSEQEQRKEKFKPNGNNSKK